VPSDLQACLTGSETNAKPPGERAALRIELHDLVHARCPRPLLDGGPQRLQLSGTPARTNLDAAVDEVVHVPVQSELAGDSLHEPAEADPLNAAANVPADRVPFDHFAAS
jgi:hypothetical protein